jgi:flagellar protein FlaG
MNVTATTPGAPDQAPATTSRSPAAATGKQLPPAGRKLPPARPEVTHGSVEKAIEQIRSYLKDSQRQLDFQYDESSGRTIIKVINPASGEVIRQIPSEEVLKLAEIIDAQGFHTLSTTA